MSVLVLGGITRSILSKKLSLSTSFNCASLCVVASARYSRSSWFKSSISFSVILLSARTRLTFAEEVSKFDITIGLVLLLTFIFLNDYTAENIAAVKLAERR